MTPLFEREWYPLSVYRQATHTERNQFWQNDAILLGQFKGLHMVRESILANNSFKSGIDIEFNVIWGKLYYLDTLIVQFIK